MPLLKRVYDFRIFFILLMIFSQNCLAAEAYFLERITEVESWYSDDDWDSVSNRMKWIISSKTGEDNSITLEFQKRGSITDSALCVVTIKGNNADRNITWIGEGSKKRLTGENGFLPLPGYPVPCDILPAAQAESKKEYKIAKIVGTETFADKYTVSVKTMDIPTAIQNGWVKSENDIPESPDLIMVTVENIRNELVVRQLWSKGSAWWLYEETPYRRSWRSQWK